MYLKKSIVVLSLLFLFACEKGNVLENELFVEKIYSVDIDEMSGLALSSSDILYTVSDNTNTIYKLSSTGKILSSFAYVGQDFEGIAINPTNRNIYVVEERMRQILVFDVYGNLLNTLQVNVEVRDLNSGLEGICINPLNGNIFVINEKSPAKLIELNSSGSLISETKLSFASDYSDICCSPDGQELWILSDESKTISICDTKGTLIKQFSVKINQMEGLAIDFNKNIIYIVSDSYKQLYKLTIND